MQAGGGIRRFDREGAAQQDRSGIQAGFHLHDADAGFRIAGEQGALDRRCTAPARQQRSVDIDAAEAQPAEGVTYAHKIEKAEAVIDWTKPAIELDRHIRAFNPFPGAQALFGGQTVKLWQASPVAGSGPLGSVLAVDKKQVVIACGAGALAVSELQKAGGKRLPVQQFLAGHPLKVGDRFDIPA